MPLSPAETHTGARAACFEKILARSRRRSSWNHGWALNARIAAIGVLRERSEVQRLAHQINQGRDWQTSWSKLLLEEGTAEQVEEWKTEIDKKSASAIICVQLS